MSSFINFNNKTVSEEQKYTAEAIKIALLKSETKSSIKAESLTKNVAEPVSLNEALTFFTDKLKAVKSLSAAIAEINEGRVKQFESDYLAMVKDIKSGYGWIDPEYVAQTWDNSSDSIDFELVRDEIFDRLIAAGLLAHADANNPEKAGKKIKSAKELYVLESATISESATKQLADEEKFELYDAELTGKSVTLSVTSTTKTWDDGVPVLKYLARGSAKPTSIQINGSFEVAHDVARGWFYFTDGRKWYALHQENGYNDPSDLPFKMTVKESKVEEASFFRLPKDVVGNDLYVVSKNLTNLYDSTSAGNDVDPGVIDSVIRGLNKIKKAVKKFDNAEDVKGSVYELEVNEDWGSSDQAAMNKSIHRDAGSPKTMPSPFDSKLRAAAEDAVDFYWDDWEEYQDDRDALIDNAVRSYLRSYFKDQFALLVRMFEGNEITEAMFSAKDHDKTLVSYAIDPRADEIYVISVAKVVDSGFPDVYKVPDKRFHVMFGMTLEDKWLKQYDKLPEVGDILPAPKKDKAFESKVTEGVMSEIDIIAKEAKNFKEFVKEFKSDDRYKGLDTAGDVEEFEAWLKSIYDAAKEDLDESVKSINEGQFSWMTQDTGNQIGSEKQNTIAVTMFDDKGNKWEERSYDGYGEFGGKDYYELLAQMNGVENADRQDGIDIAFDKKKVKGKVLFPALVEDPKRFNFKKHDFTQEAEHDPNQSWYQEEEYDESVITEAKGSALQDYVETVSQKTFKGGGNGQNLLDEAMGLAGHIDSYALGRDTRGYEEDGFYGPLTITAFKKLVDQMSADDIKNNQADKYESVVTEGRSINKIQKDWNQTTTDMQAKVAQWKEAEGDRKSELLDELKALTAKKKALEAELEDAVAGKDKDVQLAVSEGNAFLAARAKALEEGTEEFEFNGKTYPVIKEGNAFGAARAEAIAKDEEEFEVDGEKFQVKSVDKEDEDNAEEFVKETAEITLDSLVEKFAMTNEDLRTDVKKFIKENNKELNMLADNDQWDLMYQKLYSEFGVEPDSAKAKDLLKTFQFVF